MKKGFTCECGKSHEFGAYVAAHYYEPLTHTCDGCGRIHNIRGGKAWLAKQPKKSPSVDAIGSRKR